MIQCKCITITGKDTLAQAQTTHHHSRVLLTHRSADPLKGFVPLAGKSSISTAPPSKALQNAAQCCMSSVCTQGALVSSAHATPQEQTPCCNRILLELASRRHFQVPYGDAGRERISVSQQEMGAVTHSFTPTPFFPGLKWVIWCTVGEQASFISVLKRMRKKNNNNSFLMVKSKNSKEFTTAQLLPLFTRRALDTEVTCSKQGEQE